MAFNVKTASDSFNRPSDTTQYGSGDLVANTTAASPAVTPLEFTAGIASGGSFLVRRARIAKTDTSITAASFRLHLYGEAPTNIANADNAAWSTSMSSYVGWIDVDMSGSNGKVFTDGAIGFGVPTVGSELAQKLTTGTTLYGLIEARGTYTPASGETFTVTLELVQNA